MTQALSDADQQAVISAMAELLMEPEWSPTTALSPGRVAVKAGLDKGKPSSATLARVRRLMKRADTKRAVFDAMLTPDPGGPMRSAAYSHLYVTEASSIDTSQGGGLAAEAGRVIRTVIDLKAKRLARARALVAVFAATDWGGAEAAAALKADYAEEQAVQAPAFEAMAEANRDRMKLRDDGAITAKCFADIAAGACDVAALYRPIDESLTDIGVRTVLAAMGWALEPAGTENPGLDRWLDQLSTDSNGEPSE